VTEACKKKLKMFGNMGSLRRRDSIICICGNDGEHDVISTIPFINNIISDCYIIDEGLGMSKNGRVTSF